MGKGRSERQRQVLQAEALPTGSLTSVVGVATTGRRRRAPLWGCGRDSGAGHFWGIRPAVNVLAGANPDGRPELWHAIRGDVKLSNVTPAVGRRWQQPQEGEMLHASDARPDRRGALHQSVMGRRARDAELECNPVSRVGYHQLGHRVGAETGSAGGTSNWGRPRSERRVFTQNFMLLQAPAFCGAGSPARNWAGI